MANGNDSHRLEHLVHWSLLLGVSLSGLLLGSGLILAIVHGHLAPQPKPPQIGEVIHDAFTGHGSALMRLGLIVLMATPVVRVAVLAVGWAFSRNYRFALVALIVLALLALGVTLGVA